MFLSVKYIGLIQRTRALKNSAINRKVLLIGSGPSSGYIDSYALDAFRNHGGITIAVNNWERQLRICAHTPDWLVLSDPESLNDRGVNSERARSLISYVRNNSEIKLLVPFSDVGRVSSLFNNHDIYGFCDIEIPFNSLGVNILMPRPYLSMTLYKALAFAKYIRPEKIFILGMDNNFFKKIVVDEKNEIYVTSQYPDYELQYKANVATSIGHLLADHSRLMLDLYLFSPKDVINLDIYSLTDRFTKINVLPEKVQSFISEYGN